MRRARARARWPPSQAWLAASTAYLLALLGLAAARRAPAADPPPGRAAAHRRDRVPRTTRRRCSRPRCASLTSRTSRRPREVIVIADNCADATADVAPRGRRDRLGARPRRARQGPGARLGARAAAGATALTPRPWRSSTPTAWPRPRTCSPRSTRRCARGADAAQAIYDVANPDASPTAALRWAAFALKHRVRPRGRAALGLSAGLFGSGMAFRASLLRAQPWRELLGHRGRRVPPANSPEAGVRVAFAGDVSRRDGDADHGRRGPHPAAALGERQRATRARVRARRWPGRGCAGAIRTWSSPALDARGPRRRRCWRRRRSRLPRGRRRSPRSRPLTTTAAACVAGNGRLRARRAARGRARRRRSTGRLAPPRSSWPASSALFGAIARGRGTAEWLRTTREPAPPEPVEVA